MSIIQKITKQLLSLLVFVSINFSVQAAVPDNIDYQGYLADTGGSPVSGTVSVTFSLYNVDTGGVALWSDTQSVTPDNGLFNVKLGSVGNPFPAGLFDAPIYIGIDVAGDGEMSPRVAMSSAGFSHKAADADSVGGISAGSLATSTELAAHSGDTANPHAVTAAQTGAATSASFSLHTGDPSAHHNKTISFTELTDTATDAQIPNNITINQAANADTLDGLDSTAFMSSGADNWVNTTGDAMSGNLTTTGSIGIGIGSPAFSLDVRGSTFDFLAYIDNTGPWSFTRGARIIANAYSAIGSALAKGAVVSAQGGSTGGNAYGLEAYGIAYGTSTAYGVYSDADNGSTTGREWAFYGIGDNYFSGDVGIGTIDPQSKLTVSGGVTVGSAYNSNVLSDGRLAVSNNLGVGTATPAARLHVKASSSSVTSGLRLETSLATAEDWYFYMDATDDLTIRNDALDVVTVQKNTGHLGLGLANPVAQLDVLDLNDTGPVAKFRNSSTTTNADGLWIQLGPATNPGAVNDFIQFRDGDGTLVGYVNGTGTGSINYVSISDSRLKSNIVDFSSGLDIVSRIKVKKYEFKTSPGNTNIGFIAQQLKTVYPEAVSGDPEGDVEKKPMGVDYGKLTPLLVSAIQEQAAMIKKLIAKNEELEARLVTLESN